MDAGLHDTECSSKDSMRGTAQKACCATEFADIACVLRTDGKHLMKQTVHCRNTHYAEAVAQHRGSTIWTGVAEAVRDCRLLPSRPTHRYPRPPLLFSIKNSLASGTNLVVVHASRLAQYVCLICRSETGVGAGVAATHIESDMHTDAGVFERANGKW